MRTVFLDTVGLVALGDARDQWHRQSLGAFRSILQEGAVVVTTEPVMLECGNALARTTFRSAAVSLRSELLTDGRLIFQTESDIAMAWREYSLWPALHAGIVDILSFQIMRRLGITEAFTNDRHFKTDGFATLF